MTIERRSLELMRGKQVQDAANGSPAEKSVAEEASNYPPFKRAAIGFAFLLVAEFFYSWSWNTVDVLRPYIRDSLGLSLTEAGSGYSAQSAGALIGALVLGQLADKFGRRMLLMIVMVGYGVSVVAGAFVTSYVEYLLQRFVLGLFLGGIFPVVVGIYVSLFAGHIRGRLASMVVAVASAAIVALGLASGAVGADNWKTLLMIGGIPPILLAAFAMLLIPASADAKHDRGPKAPIGSRLPILQLFARGLRTRTILLTCLMGLNFFAYQAYSGWLTTYLKDVRDLPASASGSLVAWQFTGNIVGCFFWGWAGDRFGRRFPAIGFLMAAVAIAAFLNLPSDPVLLTVVGVVYGFSLSSSVIWGPWLTELYPPHLRSTAASIFNWGRIVSFFAPLITGQLAEAYGLGATMGVASATFFIAGLLWFALPETHSKPLIPGRRVSYQ